MVNSITVMHNETTTEIDALHTALQNCEDLKQELHSVIDHVHYLNKKYNPSVHLSTIEIKLDSLNAYEDDILFENNSFDLNNSTSSDSFNSTSLHQNNIEERTCNEVSQIYSEANIRMIKLKRSTESVLNSFQRIKLSYEKSVSDYILPFLKPKRRLSHDSLHDAKKVTNCTRPLTEDSTPKPRSKMFTLRTMTR